jgi:hypothetical protein
MRKHRLEGVIDERIDARLAAILKEHGGLVGAASFRVDGIASGATYDIAPVLTKMLQSTQQRSHPSGTGHHQDGFRD